MADDQEKNETVDDIDALKKALDEEKAKSESYLDNLKRSQADFQNYKKRIEQEKNESLAWSGAAFIKSMLPVVDDMERAFAMMGSEAQNLAWAEGFRQIQRKVQDVLRQYGCSEIECKGQPFDPNLHEAIMQVEGDEGMVVEELRKGYMMKNKVLRVAQVSVGKGSG